MTMIQSVNILCAIGEYPVDLTGDVTIQVLPKLIEQAGGIIVPVDDPKGDVDRLWIPAGQITGITWAEEELPVEEPADEDLAEVSIIGEEEPGGTDAIDDPKVGNNGEQLFIDD